MKVYMLTRGEYDFYAVEGIFSSLDALEQCKAKYATIAQEPIDWNDPDEYEVDELLAWEAGHSYEVRLWLDAEGTYNTYVSDRIRLRHPRECVITFLTDSYPTAHGGKHGPCFMVSSPISIEHAVKVANEKREEWLRTHSIELPESQLRGINNDLDDTQ